MDCYKFVLRSEYFAEDQNPSLLNAMLKKLMNSCPALVW